MQQWYGARETSAGKLEYGETGDPRVNQLLPE
jgi:hypothetical protein